MKLMTPDELEAELRNIVAKRYHCLHPFHASLHDDSLQCRRVEATGREVVVDGVEIQL